MNPEKDSGQALQHATPNFQGAGISMVSWIRPLLFGASQKRRYNGRGRVSRNLQFGGSTASLLRQGYEGQARAVATGAEGNRRDACSTRRRETTGGTPAPLLGPQTCILRNEYPPYLSKLEYVMRTRCRIWSGEIASQCSARGSQGRAAARPYQWKAEGPIYVFAKRTHRFLADFLVEATVNTLVATKISERNRWVRFGKRTHREGVLGL